MKNKIIHQSAYKHVSGDSVYVDDIPVHTQLLYGLVVYSPHAHARITSFDLGVARKVSGVHAVLSADDILGENNLGPIVHDEPCLANGEVNFIGQAVFLIAAETEGIAREAASLIEVEYEPLSAILTIDQAMAANSLMGPERKINCGNADKALQQSEHRINGNFNTRAQEHWYLETQTALCIPSEDDEIFVHSSTQNPSETQAIVAEVLNIPRNAVTVEIRRMGGAFGGKETQAHHVAAWAALLTGYTGRPARAILSTGSTLVVDVGPTVAATTSGRAPSATSSSIACSSASTSIC